MPWVKKLKSSFTAASALAQVESLHSAFVKNRNGYRTQLRSILQSSRELVFQLRRNPDVKSKFIRKIREMKQSRRQGLPNLALEVLTGVTGNNRAGRQRASKYAGVFEILDSEGVPADETSQAIKARGGIEKILRDHRPEVTPPESSGSMEKPDHAPRHNDQEVLCGIYMRTSDLDAMRPLRDAIPSGNWEHHRFCSLCEGQNYQARAPRRLDREEFFLSLLPS